MRGIAKRLASIVTVLALASSFAVSNGVSLRVSRESVTGGDGVPITSPSGGLGLVVSTVMNIVEQFSPDVDGNNMKAAVDEISGLLQNEINENEELTAEVASKKGEIDDAKKTQTELRYTIAASEAAFKALESKSQTDETAVSEKERRERDQTNALVALTTANSALESENAQLTQKLNVQTGALREKEQETEAKETNLEAEAAEIARGQTQLKTRNTQLTKAVIESEAKNDALTTTMQGIQSEIAGVQLMFSKCEEKVEKKTAEKKRTTQIDKMMTKAKAQADKSLEDLKATMTSITQNEEALTKSLENAKKTLETKIDDDEYIESGLTDLVQELADLRLEKEKLQVSIAGLHTPSGASGGNMASSSNGARFRTIASKVDKLGVNECGNLFPDSGSGNEKFLPVISELKRASECMKKQMAQYSQENSEKNEELNRLTAELERTATENDGVQNQLTALQTKSEAAEALLKKLAAKDNELEESLRAIGNRRKHEKIQQAELNAAKTELEDKMAKINKGIKAFDERIEAVNKKIQSQKTEFEAYKQTMEAEFAGLSNTLKELKGTGSELEAKLIALSTQLNDFNEQTRKMEEILQLDGADCDSWQGTASCSEQNEATCLDTDDRKKYCTLNKDQKCVWKSPKDIRGEISDVQDAMGRKLHDLQAKLKATEETLEMLGLDDLKDKVEEPSIPEEAPLETLGKTFDAKVQVEGLDQVVTTFEEEEIHFHFNEFGCPAPASSEDVKRCGKDDLMIDENGNVVYSPTGKESKCVPEAMGYFDVEQGRLATTFCGDTEEGYGCLKDVKSAKESIRRFSEYLTLAFQRMPNDSNHQCAIKGLLKGLPGTGFNLMYEGQASICRAEYIKQLVLKTTKADTSSPAFGDRLCTNFANERQEDPKVTITCGADICSDKKQLSTLDAGEGMSTGKIGEDGCPNTFTFVNGIATRDCVVKGIMPCGWGGQGYSEDHQDPKSQTDCCCQEGKVPQADNVESGAASTAAASSSQVPIALQPSSGVTSACGDATTVEQCDKVVCKWYDGVCIEKGQVRREVEKIQARPGACEISVRQCRDVKLQSGKACSQYYDETSKKRCAERKGGKLQTPCVEDKFNPPCAAKSAR